MLENLLSKVEIEIGTHTEEEFVRYFKSKTSDELSKISDGLLKELKTTFETLLSMSRSIFGKKVFSSSIEELRYNEYLAPIICELRIRPENEYYIKMRKPIPTPENPDGPDATGLEISFKLLKGYSIPERTIFPSLFMQFMVWGDEERKAFGKLLKNYYRVVELLLVDLNVELYTAYPFDRVEKLKTNNVFKKLFAYYEADDDEESSFSFDRVFTFGEDYNDIIRIFLVFTAFYECCLGYLTKKKDPDKIIDYYLKLKGL